MVITIRKVNMMYFDHKFFVHTPDFTDSSCIGKSTKTFTFFISSIF